MILYINSCVREESRTAQIAAALLEKLGGAFEEIRLADEGLTPLSLERLERRTELLERGCTDDPEFCLARKFARADLIVIAAPYWDLSFPSILKTFIENIYITGIVTEYGPDGMPHGLCSAKKLYYVTTAGGPYDPDFSYGYVKELATRYFGIGETELIAAEMLDVEGVDAERILKKTIDEVAQHI